MARPTQAQMSKTIRKSQPDVAKDMTKRQMEYYMGAKLIEVGVNPNSAIYRWSVEIKGNNEIWTYSAYWDDSKEQQLKQEQELQDNL